MSNQGRRALAGPPALAILLLAGVAPAAEPTVSCSVLEDLKIEDTNLLSSTVVPAKGDLPEYCRMLGYVRPAINFEIRLPTQNWNGKFYMAGCGGACGKLRSDAPGFANAMNHGLRRSYAVSTMDGGHWGRSGGDTRWANQDPVARFDYEERAVNQMARVTKEIIKAYYGNDPKKSYFAGCSNGGRQGHMEAWKYPDDFDGIISSAPSLRFTGLDILWAWNVKANTGPDGKNVVAFAKLPMIAEAVYAACAGEGGLIDDPRACSFQPESLRCKGADGPDCLTAAEVSTIEKWYGGPRNSRGEQLYPGASAGTEPYWSGWPNGKDEETWKLYKGLVSERLRWYGFAEDPGPAYDVVQFDFDKDPARLTVGLNRDASSTDLSKFRVRGGKLLVYHGWADEEVPPEGTRSWYEDLTKATGGEMATREFARLFMVPGMSHCGVQVGPGVHHSGFDPLPALERWVEEGVAPESIVMTKTDKDGKVEWARPVCVYPQVARYKGTGDIKDPAGWACTSGQP